MVRIVESFIIFPIATIPMSFGTLPQTGASIVATLQSASESDVTFSEILSQSEAEKEQTEKEEELRIKKAEAIDAYFRERKMPLEGMGMKMVIEAEENNLDWRLIPAIAVRESTGGKFDCKKVDYNAFGWGSCKIGFESNDHAVETVARNLGGNNPRTAKHYDNKTTLQILRAYNPPSVVPRYAEQVISIMNAIGDVEIALVKNS